EGRVVDAFVRYEGSRWNRTNGQQIPAWTVPGPNAGPNPPLALSWNITFPAYRSMDKRAHFTLNKLNQACPGTNTVMGSVLYPALGVPASQVKYARLYINGAYYHYVMDYEHPDSDMMKRYNPPNTNMGDLFKSVGASTDEGPFGWGDERDLGAFC